VGECKVLDVDEFVPPPPPDDEEENTYPTTNMNHFVEPYPDNASHGMRKSKTRFKKWLEIQQGEGKKPWEPFSGEEEWALLRWLIKNVGQKSTDEYLKLQIVCENY
jgi:hypothetical protein